MEKKINLTEEQMKLIVKMAIVAIGNGNTVSTKPFDPTPEQYKELHRIVNAMK